MQELSDDVRHYFKELAKRPVLTREQEFELGKRVIEGDQEAIDKLVESNLRFVTIFAKKYSKVHNVPYMDLIGYGNEGLVIAANRFDYRRGFRFISYAGWWIRQSILRNLQDNESFIRLPINRRQSYIKVNKLMSEYQNFDSATSNQLQKLVEEETITKTEADLWLEHKRGILSLEASVSESNDSYSLADIIPYEDPSSEELAIRDSVEKLLNITRLTNRERDIIGMYYGITSNEKTGKTLVEIGAEYGLTRERIRQIRDRAMKKIKRAATLNDISY